jgi:uncharacterized protein (TIGR00369 family)
MIKTTEDLMAAGYRTWGDSDPFEGLIGPLYFKENGDGTYRSAFVAEPRHCNAGKMLHGGLLMSFADFSLFAIAKDVLEGKPCVTVAMNSEFVAAGQAGHLIESTGEVTRATRSLIFVRGKIFSGEQTILSFSGIIKRIRERA